MGPPEPDQGDAHCCDCSQPLPEGAPYSERLIALVGAEDTIVDIVCVYCASPADVARAA